ncbi:MAG: inositol monophosphatase family protein [bacterium]
MIDIAIDAAKEAGKIQREYLTKKKNIYYKGKIDLVTDIDRLCEKIIIERIRSKFPDHGVLAEESPPRPYSSHYKWIIDPLDGTTNYAHGYPCFCTSIALEKDEEIIHGIVYDPMRDELFSGERGKGATLNGNPIHVSPISELDKSLLVTGFPYDIEKKSHQNLNHFKKFLFKAQGIRRDGSAALNLCYVAAGRFDGFWESTLHPWDMAAGSLIVTEAGGMLSSYTAGSFSIYAQEIVASNGHIHAQMLGILSAQ